MPTRKSFPKIQPGQAVSATWANQVADAFDGMRGFSGDGNTTEVSESLGVFTFKAKIPPPALATPVMLCVFKSQTDEYIICRALNPDGSQGTTDLKVAKPSELRRSSYDGKTFSIPLPVSISVTYTYLSEKSRSGVSGNIAEVEYITPDYQVDQEIRVSIERTTANDGTGSDPPTFCTMQDMNTAGRAWGRG